MAKIPRTKRTTRAANKPAVQSTKNWCGFKCTVKDGVKCGGNGGAIYGLGFIAALIYCLTTATSVWAGLVGVVKAILWPAFVVFGLMKFLGL